MLGLVSVDNTTAIGSNAQATHDPARLWEPKRQLPGIMGQRFVSRLGPQETTVQRQVFWL